jgi:hypothetical protein
MPADTPLHGFQSFNGGARKIGRFFSLFFNGLVGIFCRASGNFLPHTPLEH